MDQFWSPATNRRDDVFGGSLDNRLRFTFRVLDAIRGRIGPDFIVGIRMVADQDWDQGLSRAEVVEIARRLVASGQIDLIGRTAWWEGGSSTVEMPVAAAGCKKNS